jgi:predicted nucleic acid-binding protein
MSLRVLVDANVLYSRTLRDWLLLIAVIGPPGVPFHLCWTEDILAELVYRLRRAHPGMDGGALTRIRDRITRTLARTRIDDYRIDGTYGGSDPDDAHVHAAAVAGEVDAIVTSDRGFSAGLDGRPTPYRFLTPDQLLMHAQEVAPELVESVAIDQARYWRRRPGSASLSGALVRAGCPQFARVVDTPLRGLGIRAG